VITYDLAIAAATYKKLKNNTYEIKVSVSAKRYQTNQNGKEGAICIDELLSIEVFKKFPKATNKSEILYLKPYLINAEEMEFTFSINDIPKYISIDPYASKLDR
jgi:hypothetical protein